jgi:thioredoxin 1
MKKLIILAIALFFTAFNGYAQDSMMMAADNPARPMGGLEKYMGLEEAGMKTADGPVVLFFFADWCPTCQAALKNLKADKEKLGDITVLIVNYDREKELKRKYGVTYQHTYVQIDSRGNSIALWNGGGIDGILTNTVRKEMN